MTGNSHEAIFRLLLEARADANSKDVMESTPLSPAARNGYEAVVKLLQSPSPIIDACSV